MKLTRRSLLLASTAMVLATKARAFLHMAGGGGTGGGGSQTPTSIAASPNPVTVLDNITTGTVIANLIIGTSDSNPYTGSAPTLTSNPGTRCAIAGSAPNFNIVAQHDFTSGDDGTGIAVNFSVTENSVTRTGSLTLNVTAAGTGAYGILTVANDGGTTYGAYTAPANPSVAGVPTRIVAVAFPPGAIRPYNGEFPKFTDVITSTEQLYSMTVANACRFWPPGTPGDSSGGSLMWAAFSLLMNVGGVAAGGTRQIAIDKKTVLTTGGTFGSSGYGPAQSTHGNRAELLAQSLGVWAPIYTHSPFDSGTNWGAVLSTANVNNIRQTRKYMQGAAGDVWCDTVDFSGGTTGSFPGWSSTQNAAPHGLLAADIYSHSMVNGADGSFGGVRFWADIRQPYIDGPVSGFGGSHLSPAGNSAKDFRYFAPPDGTVAGLAWVENGNYHKQGNWPFASSYSMGPQFIPVPGIGPFTGTITARIATATGGANIFTYSADQIIMQFSGLAGAAIESGMHIQDVDNNFPSDAYIGSQFNSTSWQVRGTNVASLSTISDTITIEDGHLTVSSGNSPTFGNYILDTSNNILGQMSSIGTPGQIFPVPSMKIGPETMGAYESLVLMTTSPPQQDYLGPAIMAYWLSNTANFGGFIGGPGIGPTGDGLYWYYYSNGGPAFAPYATSLSSSSSLAPANISGTNGTATPMPISEPGMRYAIGGADSQWQFFQGTGSISTDTPLRGGVPDNVAWVKSQVIPPYACAPNAKQPTIGAVDGNAQVQPYWGSGGYQGPAHGISAPWQHWPYCMGGNDAGNNWLVGGGWGQYLIVSPLWATSFFYIGDAISHFSLVNAAIGAGNWLFDYVMSSNPTVPPNCSGNKSPTGATRTYVGMGPSTPFGLTGCSFGPAFGAEQENNWPGYTPPTNPLLFGIAPNVNQDHFAEFASDGFLFTGRPELLDRLKQNSLYTVGYPEPLGTVYTQIPGKTYYNIMYANGSGLRRHGSNKLRWLTKTALLYPSDPSGLNNVSSPQVTFDGSQYDKYLFDTVDDNYQVLVDLNDPQYASALWPISSTIPGAYFSGYIDNGSGAAGNQLTVTSVSSGTIVPAAGPGLPGQPIADVAGNIPFGYFITAQTSGTTGGAGTYTIAQQIAGVYHSNPILVGSSGSPKPMYCGAPAIITNDKARILSYPGLPTPYVDWGESAIGECFMPHEACQMVVIGSPAVVKYIQNYSRQYQSWIDHRGGIINLWGYSIYYTVGCFINYPGNVLQTVFNDTEIGWMFSDAGDSVIMTVSCSNVTPGPSTPAFSASYTTPYHTLTPGPGDYVGFEPFGATLPPGLSFETIYEIADYTQVSGGAGSGSITFNLKDSRTGVYVTPGAAMTNFYSTIVDYRFNDFGAINGTSMTGDWANSYYAPFWFAGFRWAQALVNAGYFADTWGYINNAVQDGETRRLAYNDGSGTPSNYNGTTLQPLWVDWYGPSNNLLNTFTP